MNKVLITGHNGYNGVIVTKRLRKAGFHTIGWDRCFFSQKLYDDPETCVDEHHEQDYRDISANDLKGVDAIVHLAALSNDALGELDPQFTDEINRKGTVKLAKLAKECGVKKFIYASSCSVYGIQDSSQSANENSPLAPLTAYAKAKVQAEEELSELISNDFKVIMMRNATMHGLSPKLRLDLVVNNLVGYAHTHGVVKILSDGSPWRPLLSLEDFAEFVLLFLQKEAKHSIYNIGFDEENYQVKDIGELVAEITNCKLEINPNQTPDERSYRVDFSRLKNEFPEISLKESVPQSIKNLWDAYKKYGLSKEDFEGSGYFRIRTLKHLMDTKGLKLI